MYIYIYVQKVFYKSLKHIFDYMYLNYFKSFKILKTLVADNLIGEYRFERKLIAEWGERSDIWTRTLAFTINSRPEFILEFYHSHEIGSTKFKTVGVLGDTDWKKIIL